MSFEDRIRELGIVIPSANPPVGAYVATIEAKGFLYVSGQLSFTKDRELMTGKVGQDLDLASGIKAAERCGLALIAQMKAALGSLERVEHIVKLTVFVSSAPGFQDQPKVGNGASDLMIEVFGEAGRHARSAVGVVELPLGAAVEIDAVVAVR